MTNAMRTMTLTRESVERAAQQILDAPVPTYEDIQYARGLSCQGSITPQAITDTAIEDAGESRFGPSDETIRAAAKSLYDQFPDDHPIRVVGAMPGGRNVIVTRGAIIVDVNSPGGTISGLKDLMSHIGHQIDPTPSANTGPLFIPHVPALCGLRDMGRNSDQWPAVVRTPDSQWPQKPTEKAIRNLRRLRKCGVKRG